MKLTVAFGKFKILDFLMREIWKEYRCCQMWRRIKIHKIWWHFKYNFQLSTFACLTIKQIEVKHFENKFCDLFAGFNICNILSGANIPQNIYFNFRTSQHLFISNSNIHFNNSIQVLEIIIQIPILRRGTYLQHPSCHNAFNIINNFYRHLPLPRNQFCVLY